jgi:octaprenyl-diphosphate synthase
VGSLDALDILSRAAATIAEGEVMQLAASKNLATTEDEYLAITRAKTAALFAAAVEVGPAIAGASRAERAAFRSFGTNLGLAFQLVDDALDYGGNPERLGKELGGDFREGKITLPLLLAYRRGSENSRIFWERALARDQLGKEDFAEAVRLMRSQRAIEDTIERARHFGDVARDALAPMADSPHKTALLEVIEFCIERSS